MSRAQLVTLAGALVVAGGIGFLAWLAKGGGSLEVAPEPEAPTDARDTSDAQSPAPAVEASRPQRKQIVSLPRATSDEAAAESGVRIENFPVWHALIVKTTDPWRGRPPNNLSYGIPPPSPGSPLYGYYQAILREGEGRAPVPAGEAPGAQDTPR